MYEQGVLGHKHVGTAYCSGRLLPPFCVCTGSGPGAGPRGGRDVGPNSRGGGDGSGGSGRRQRVGTSVAHWVDWHSGGGAGGPAQPHER